MANEICFLVMGTPGGAAHRTQQTSKSQSKANRGGHQVATGFIRREQRGTFSGLLTIFSRHTALVMGTDFFLFWPGLAWGQASFCGSKPIQDKESGARSVLCKRGFWERQG